MRFPAVLALLLLCGCGSVQEHRARQMRGDFERLDAVQREDVLASRVQPGFTRVMVYIALGHPWRRLGNGAFSTWIYRGWIDKDGRFRSTADLHFGGVEDMKELHVRFRGDEVVSTSVVER